MSVYTEINDPAIQVENRMRNDIDSTLGLDFEGEVYLSTDGKQTVHFKANTAEGRIGGLKWAFKVYTEIAETLGTKADMWAKAMGNGNSHPIEEPKTIVERTACEVCGSPAEIKSGVKNNRSWRGAFCTKEKEHVKWLTA